MKSISAMLDGQNKRINVSQKIAEKAKNGGLSKLASVAKISSFYTYFGYMTSPKKNIIRVGA